MYERVIVDAPADVNRGPIRACSPAQVDEMRRLRRGGVSMHVIARAYGVTTRTVYRYLDGPAEHVKVVVGEWIATFSVAPDTVPVRVTEWTRR